MSVDVRSTALRQAARAARNGQDVLLYSSGGQLVLVLGAVEREGRLHGQCHTRTVASAGLARAVVARFVQDFQCHTHLTAPQALDASIVYAEAAWRAACRRAGRRVA